MDIQVGDRVYWRYTDDKIIHISIITSKNDLAYINQKEKIIFKIERPKYELVEEKKELLTEDEKAFLKLYIQFIKYYGSNIWEIKFEEESIELYSITGISLMGINYPSVLNFDNVKLGKYSVHELGIEGN